MKKHQNYVLKDILFLLMRLALTIIFISSLFYFCGNFYLKFVLPLISYGIECGDSKYEVREVELVNNNSIEQIHYKIRTHKPFVDETGKFWPASDQTSGIHLFTVYIHPIITLSLLLSWPFLSKKKKLWAILISIPLLIIVEMIDIPVNLLYTLKESYNVDSLQLHLHIQWYHEFLYHFLNTGGRQFLAILVSVVSVAPFHFTGKKQYR